MEVIRWVLIAASAALGVVGYMARFTGMVEVLVIGAFAVLNLVYLLSVPPRPREGGRVSRIFGLWLNAKEADLQERVQRFK
jgi:hypothetical protein